MDDCQPDYSLVQSNYLQQARESAKRARVELSTNEDERVRYAALEIRMALEALTYHRALVHRKEIPPKAYAAWQPRKVLEMLKEHMGNDIDRPYSLAIQPEGSSEVISLGSDRPLTLGEVKKNYDALGSLLHLPSLRQSTTKPFNFEKFRRKCESILAIIEDALSSNVWTSFGLVAQIECMRRECGKLILRRIPVQADAVKAKCFECNAEYLVKKESDSYCWQAQVWEFNCHHCQEVNSIWICDIALGKRWVCHSCGKKSEIVLTFRDLDKTQA